MKSLRICAVPMLALIVSAGCANEDKPPVEPAPKPIASTPAPTTLTAEDSVLVSITAKVQAIDLKKREVTLKGALGNTVTFTVDKAVTRLDEVKVGDEVTAAYYVSIAGELRAPTEEEKKNPITLVEGVARAPKGTDPGAGGVRVVKVVATVEGLDLPTQTVTLAGPLGNSVTVRARKLENLKKLRLGDTIVVTYTEAVAIALEKVSAKK